MKKFLVGAIIVGLLVPATTLAAKKDRIDGAFGANIHLRQRITESDWDEVMAKAEEAGVQWGREEFDWNTIEPADDEFNFDQYDAVVDQYESHGIKMVGLLTYSADWAASGEFDPPDTTAWKSYVSTVSERYAGRVDHWEIWNEPNHDGFWMGTTQEYVDLLQATNTALENGNPNAKLVLGGLSGADTDFLAEVYQRLNAPEVIDIVTIHPYRTHNGNFNAAPEAHKDGLNRLVTDIANSKAIVQQYDNDATPIWLTEIGWPTHTDGVSKKQQAQFLMRAYTMVLTLPQVKKVFWYSFTDTSSDATDEEANFGLLKSDYTKKKSFSAYQFLKQNLNRRYPVKNQEWFTDSSGEVVDGMNSIAAWSNTGSECTTTQLRQGRSRLLIDYRFTGSNNCYTVIARNAPLQASTRAIRFSGKGEADDTTLRLRIVDATGETFQYIVGYLPNEWLTYTVQLSDFATTWNGDGDGKLDLPLTLESFVLDDNDGSRASGTVRIDWIESTSIGKTSVVILKKGRKKSAVVWSNRSARKRKLPLSGVSTARIKRWNKSNINRSAGAHSTYAISPTRSVKFIEER